MQAGFYDVEYRNRKNDAGVWEKVPVYVVNDRFPYGHGEKSVFLIERFMKLKNEEAVAIRWHMGGLTTRRVPARSPSQTPTSGIRWRSSCIFLTWRLPICARRAVNHDEEGFL